MHDNYIIGYSVKIKEKVLELQTYSEVEGKMENITFSGVLTHSFECILEYNQIFEIVECEIGNFINDNRELLKKLEGYCWPIDFRTEEELKEFLLLNSYKYIRIDSSFGMYGWVLAKSYRIVKGI